MGDAHTIDRIIDNTLNKLLYCDLEKLDEVNTWSDETLASLKEGTHHVTHVLVAH